jgi:hypothetical protein
LARLWVRRLKNGLAVEQPITGDELRAIRRYLATRPDRLPWLFVSERRQPLTRQSVNYLIATVALRAALPPVHPHMLRHSCGFALANRGYDLRLIQDYLGHRDPRHTVHYTRVAGSRFEGIWSSSVVPYCCARLGLRFLAVTCRERPREVHRMHRPDVGQAFQSDAIPMFCQAGMPTSFLSRWSRQSFLRSTVGAS